MIAIMSKGNSKIIISSFIKFVIYGGVSLLIIKGLPWLLLIFLNVENYYFDMSCAVIGFVVILRSADKLWMDIDIYNQSKE